MTSEKKRPATPCPVLKDQRGPVPYIALWTAELLPSPAVVPSMLGGIGYADETLLDRDQFGVLWTRVLSRRGDGEPVYDQQHCLRQRETMWSLLCQVCAAPADQNERGVLWLLHDHRGDWPNWPERMANSHPPLCRRCATISIRRCPSFASGFVAVRAQSTVVGVSGAFYRRGPLLPRSVGRVTARYDDPARHWVRAALLLRELHHCAFEDL